MALVRFYSVAALGLSLGLFCSFVEGVVASASNTPVESLGITEAFGKGAYLMLLAFNNAPAANRCMCGGLSMLSLVFLRCAALVFVWRAPAFSFREYINGEAIIPERMRDLPIGGGATTRVLWRYKGPHGSGMMEVLRKPGWNAPVPPGPASLRELEEAHNAVDNAPESLRAMEFVALAVAWVYYFDELQHDMTQPVVFISTDRYGYSPWVSLPALLPLALGC